MCGQLRELQKDIEAREYKLKHSEEIMEKQRAEIQVGPAPCLCICFLSVSLSLPLSVRLSVSRPLAVRFSSLLHI